MISETASKEQISRMDELPASNMGQSRKRNETEVSEEGEEIDHIARIFEFFSRDSVIRFALVIQFVVAVLSYWMLDNVYQTISKILFGLCSAVPLAVGILFKISSPQNIFDFLDIYSNFSGIQYNILQVAVIFIISIPFTVVYFLFRKRKKLFLYYILATFPQQILLLVGAAIVFAMLLLPFHTMGTMK